MHFPPKPKPGEAAPKRKPSQPPVSAIVDVQVVGAGIWQQGKFRDFIQSTTYDPALGYPLVVDDSASADANDA